MAVVGGRLQIGIEDTGTDARVPDEPLARLMYYFNCVLGTLEMNNQGGAIGRLCDYANYRRLSNDEKKALVEMCEQLSPSFLEGKVFKHDERISGNKFIKITLSDTRFAATEGILIGGVRRNATNLMLYENSWMRRNYYEPLDKLKSSCTIL